MEQENNIPKGFTETKKRAVYVSYMTYDQVVKEWVKDNTLELINIIGKCTIKKVITEDKEHTFEILTPNGALEFNKNRILLLGPKKEIYPCEIARFEELYDIGECKTLGLLKIKSYRKTPDEITMKDIYCVNDAHHYLVKDKESGQTDEIKFVKGGRNTEGHTNDLTHEALIEIVIHRMEWFIEQYGDEEGQGKAVEHLKKALHISNDRSIARSKVGTLGNDGEDYKENN